MKTHLHTCYFCKKRFKARRQRQKYCGNVCVQKAYYARNPRRELFYCVTCGKELSGKQARYCSTACRYEAMRQRRRKRRGSTFVCVVCERPLPAKKKKYCSKNCTVHAANSRKRLRRHNLG